VPNGTSSTGLQFLRRIAFAPAAASLALAAACGGGRDADTIDRDVFIAAYVDLRVAALDTDSARIAAADRDGILARHGVTEEDLTRFAELHAEDLDFMRDVWTDVEAAMDREPPGSDDSDPNGS
jgi:hypothetical protein